jgi:aspartate/methionine/tyrosine aminotransferase
VAALKDYTTICSSAPSEILSLIALRAKERILERHTARIRRTVESLRVFLSAHEELFRCVMPRGGTMCFPRYLAPEGASAFADRVRSGAAIMLLPSSVYGYGDAHFRVGLGREKAPEILELLHRFLLA